MVSIATSAAATSPARRGLRASARSNSCARTSGSPGHAEGENQPGRNVADVAAAEERQHVVLAEAVDLDVLHDDHAVGLLREDRAVDQLDGIGALTRREERERGGDALRRLDEAFALRVFAE